MKSLKNVSLSDFRRFLAHVQCELKSTKGGHEKWTRADLLRPVIIQTHIDPIPEFIIASNLRTLGLPKEALLNFLNGR